MYPVATGSSLRGYAMSTPVKAKKKALDSAPSVQKEIRKSPRLVPRDPERRAPTRLHAITCNYSNSLRCVALGPLR